MHFQKNLAGKTAPASLLCAVCLPLLALCLTGAQSSQAQVFNVSPKEIDISQIKGNETDPAIAIDPLNPADLFVAATTDANFPGLFVASSINLGANWTSYSSVVTNASGTTITNHVIANGNDSLTPAYGEASVTWDAYGNLFVAYLPATFEGVAVVVSTNGGKTFTEVTNLVDGDATDLPRITSPAVGAGVGSVWLVYKDYTLATTPLVAQGLQTTGLGSIGTFGNPQFIPSSTDGGFPDISVGPAGQVMVAFQDNITNSAQSHIFTTVNTNAFGGGAFSHVVTATSDAVGGFTYITAEKTGIGVNAAAGIAWNTDPYSSLNGQAYLIYTGRSSATNALEIDFRSSTENGANWGAETKINDDTNSNDHFFPRIAVDPVTGIIAASWYDCRNDMGAASAQVTNNYLTSVTLAGINVTNITSSVGNSDTVTISTNADSSSITIAVTGMNMTNFELSNITNFNALTMVGGMASASFDNNNVGVSISAGTNGNSVTVTLLETNIFPDAFTEGTPNAAPIMYSSVSLDGGASFARNESLNPFSQLFYGPAIGFVSSVTGSSSTTGFGHYTGLAFFDGNFFPVWADNSDITTNNPDGANSNFDIATIPAVVPTADISVFVTNSPNPVLSAGVLIYYVIVSNNGPSVGSPVSVTNIIAPGLDFQSAVPALGGSYTVRGQTVIFTLPMLAPGASATNIIRVTASTSTYATNVTMVGSPLPDTIATNNTFALATLIAGEDLALGMTELETNAFVGDTNIYFIAVTNLGPSMNGDVIVTNILSANLLPIQVLLSQSTFTFTNYGNTLVFNLGALGTNQTAYLTTYAVTLDAGTIARSIASVSSEDVDTNLLNNSASSSGTITGEDLALSMSSSPGTTQTGLPITYSLTVTNFGPSTNESIVITNQLSTNLSQITLTEAPNNTEFLITNNLLVVGMPPLGLDQSESMVFTAVPTSPGTATNLAVVGTPLFDTNFFNNTAISVTVVTQAPPMIYSLKGMGFADSALIVWNTDFPGTGQVEYGLTPNYGSVSWLNPTPTNFHVALLGGLIPGTNYYFNVLSTVSGILYTSNGTFSTAATLILNTSDASYSGLWTASSQDPGIFGPYYQYAATTVGNATASATYHPDILTAGNYGVSVWYPEDPSFSTNTQLLITGGTNELSTAINQSTNGGGWQTVATNVYMAAGLGNSLVILNNTGETNRSVVANGARWSFELGQDTPTNGTVPAWWANFFFSTNIVGSADADGDGYSNYSEYVFGTDPNDAASHLNFSVTPSGTNSVTVVFSPWVGGRVYQLQSTTNLTSPDWLALTNAVSVDANGEGVFTVPQTNGPPTFYRLNAHF